MKSQDDIWDHNRPIEMLSGSPGVTQEWPRVWQSSGRNPSRSLVDSAESAQGILQ